MGHFYDGFLVLIEIFVIWTLYGLENLTKEKRNELR